MNTSIDHLRSIVEDETSHFCDTEQALQEEKGTLGRTYGDPTLHARTTNCGIATALIQHNLRTHHNIATDRLFGEPPLAPRERYNSRKFGHVLLRTETALIDPTYSQLFSYVGVSVSRSRANDFIYPEPLALTIDLENPEKTLDSLVDSLEEASQTEIAKRDDYAPLRGKGSRAIRAAIYDIYNIDNYVPYEIETYHPSFDYIEALKQISSNMRTPQ